MSDPTDIIEGAFTGSADYRQRRAEGVVEGLDAAGYVIVPKEPTDIMKTTGGFQAGQARLDNPDIAGPALAGITYIAMLAAKP